MWDLVTKENWQLILSEKRIVTYKDGTLPTNEKYKYIPISPIYTNPNFHVLLIGIYSESSKPHWFLGARASQYLYVSPSTSNNFISGVQTSEVKRIGLNRLTLVEFPNYNVLPYVLQLEIPYWLEDIYVEVWEYQGVIDDTTQQFDFEEILERLDRIEYKIDNQYNI